jgi:hypothetical protein
MSRPISETPILRGRDAAKFIEEMKKSENTCISSDERKRIKIAFDRIQSLTHGNIRGSSATIL